MPSRILSLVIAGFLSALLLWRALPSVPLSDEWGDAESRTAAAAVVRAAYAGEPVPDSPRIPGGQPRRVIVTAFGEGWHRRAEALEATTAASLERAARDLGESNRRALERVGLRGARWIVVDVVSGEHILGNAPDLAELESSYETGVDGLRAEYGGAAGVVTPGDPITEGWFSPRKRIADLEGGHWATRGDEGAQARDTALTRLQQAAGVRIDPSKVRWTRFRTSSFLIDLEGSGEPIALYRGMPVGPLVPTPEAIHTASIAGGEWLVSMLDASGRFQYTYVPNRDEDTPPGSYSFIRHTATAWMMVRLGRRFDRPDWVEAAVRALRWSQDQVRVAAPASAGRAPRGAPRAYVSAPSEVRGGLGHNALVVIAFAEIRDTLTPEQLAMVRAVGTSLEMMLRCKGETPDEPCTGGDGGFYESEHENLSRPPDKRDQLPYEPGEGLLALATLAEMFPEEPHWLESALVSARYQAGKFQRAGGGLFDLKFQATERLAFADRVHWTTMALEKLAMLTGDRQWAKVCTEMGDAVLASGSPPITMALTTDARVIGPVPWDYAGSFPLLGRVPRTTPTGSRAEALNVARRCALRIGRSAKRYESQLLLTAGFQLRNRFTETSCYFCPRPEKALGAFRAGLTDNEIRIDFIQHVIAGQADTLDWYPAAIPSRAGLGEASTSASTPDR